MKPIIGVPLRYQHLSDSRPIVYMPERVRRTLIQAGAHVRPISPIQDVDYIDTKGNEFAPLTEEEKETIERELDLLDGLFIPGGIKFTPYDRYLFSEALTKNIPILGVCLGMQIMSTYKKEIDLEKIESTINHNQGSNDDLLSHSVKLNTSSKLYNIIGSEEFMVNSFHNYHITDNPLYNVVGLSEDGIIEAIEYPGDTFIVGVQWHPEISYEFDSNSALLINEFIKEAIKNKKC